MQHRFGGVAGGWLAFAATLAWLAPACEVADPTPAKSTPGGVFGGTGGVAEAVPLAGSSGSPPLGSGGSGGAASGDCHDTPPGTRALIDDFDDGDNVAAAEPDREAYWFTIHDDSQGTLEPANDFVPSPGGYRSTKSAHVSATGYSIWGAALVANISHKAELRCPYDASAFAGLRFVARGHGSVRVQLEMPEVIDKEYGGTCDPKAGQVCYDAHGTYVTLTDDYEVYELPWASFQQRGFGTQLVFNPKTLLALYFSMEQTALPVELWLDQVELWDGKPTSDGAGGAASGAGGAAGQATGGQSTEAGGAAGGDG